MAADVDADADLYALADHDADANACLYAAARRALVSCRFCDRVWVPARTVQGAAQDRL